MLYVPQWIKMPTWEPLLLAVRAEWPAVWCEFPLLVYLHLHTPTCMRQNVANVAYELTFGAIKWSMVLNRLTSRFALINDDHVVYLL